MFKDKNHLPTAYGLVCGHNHQTQSDMYRVQLDQPCPDNTHYCVTLITLEPFEIEYLFFEKLTIAKQCYLSFKDAVEKEKVHKWHNLKSKYAAY